MIMKYKVGDIVKVKEDLKVGKDFGRLCVCQPMAELAGELVTISSVNDDDYHIEEDDGTYYWIDEFFEDENESGDYDVDKIIKKVLSEMDEETKDILIKEMIKGENCISIVSVPVYETICRRNGISIQRIVGTKYSVTVVSKDGTVVL
jgi:hypothetical protein